MSQDEETGEGEEDGAEDIHGRLIDPISAAAGVVASGNLARRMAGPVLEFGARDWHLHGAAGGATGGMPIPEISGAQRAAAARRASLRTTWHKQVSGTGTGCCPVPLSTPVARTVRNCGFFSSWTATVISRPVKPSEYIALSLTGARNCIPRRLPKGFKYGPVG